MCRLLPLVAQSKFQVVPDHISWLLDLSFHCQQFSVVFTDSLYLAVFVSNDDS
jgi:hypothetical protein